MKFHQQILFLLFFGIQSAEATPRWLDEKTVREEYAVGAESLELFKKNVNLYEHAANLFYINGVPSDATLRTAAGITEHNFGDVVAGIFNMWGESLTDPQWWVNSAFMLLAPQANFSKISAATRPAINSVKLAIDNGWSNGLSKMSQFGYKMGIVNREMVFYAELNKEIAHFTTSGALRPSRYLVGENAIGNQQLIDRFDDAFFVNVNGTNVKGTIELYKNSSGVYGWRVVSATTGRQSWNGYANIFKANADEIAEAAAKIKNYRVAQNAGTQGNYGYLEGKIGNITKNGEMVRSGSPDNNIVEIFEAQYVNSNQVVQTSEINGAWLRNTDSEYKMLNRLANDLKATKGKSYPEITGELKIVSERQYCPSCQGVIQQFQEMFPNVKLILIDNIK